MYQIYYWLSLYLQIAEYKEKETEARKLRVSACALHYVTMCWSLQVLKAWFVPSSKYYMILYIEQSVFGLTKVLKTW